MAKYSVGIDFGTLSGRALLADVSNGREIACVTYEYPHGVMSDSCGGKKLPMDWALQDPRDYLEVIVKTVPALLEKTKVNPKDIIGIGIDFTACTPLPVYSDGTPLCFTEKWKDEPHAYVKLWKHHASQPQADRLNETAEKTGQEWLSTYGGKISSEWMIPKLMQILDECPELYSDMDYFVESGDWVVWQLTGNLFRNTCAAGYKSIWSSKDGYPSKEFFRALDARHEDAAETKLSGKLAPVGTCAGGLTEKMAALTGLAEGTPVAVMNVDAHVSVPAFGITEPGHMLAIVGTSTCHMLVDREYLPVNGVCGIVEDGILPGMYGYEAGQSCVGDHFAWFVENCLPGEYRDEAKSRGISPHVLLTEKAELLKPGQSGLVALDWWNGNRSILVDTRLSGLMIGMTLATKPEEMYRALIEATAYGTREIIENYRKSGVAVNAFTASGGIPNKNPMLCQIYSDVLNMPIRVVSSTQGPALGAAIFGAVAAGKAAGGYDDIYSAGEKMGATEGKTYYPNPENARIYDKLFAEYEKLHDCFGRTDDMMKRLRAIAQENR